MLGVFDNKFVLGIKKLREDAYLPKRQLTEDAGYDIYSPYEVIVPARGKIFVNTGIALVLPECPFPNHVYCFKIESRSGLSKKKNIEKGAGVIDKGYIDEVAVILYNHSDTDYKIEKGDRIAQGIIIPVAIPEVIEISELPTTDRGIGGFGSTGR